MVTDQFPARFGKYIILDRINAGGMAEVFRAKITGAEQFERLIAIKCMLPELLEDDTFTTMFIDEAKLASQLTHANIVQIYELGRLNERLYIAMELVNGRDVRHILRTARANLAPIPLGFAAYVVAKAAEGLDFAHRKAGANGEPLALVHRDVSPQNILVSYDGEVKVVDFGIAKAEARATETQMRACLKGKFAYMAPEQVQRRSHWTVAPIFLPWARFSTRLSPANACLPATTICRSSKKFKDAKLPDFSAHPARGQGRNLGTSLLRKSLARKKPDDALFTFASEMAEDARSACSSKIGSIFRLQARQAQFMQTPSTPTRWPRACRENSRSTPR